MSDKPTCRKCKTAKEPYLFTPSQLRAKSPLCRECVTADNKNRYIKAYAKAPSWYLPVLPEKIR